jgi:hypothetical protein
MGMVARLAVGWAAWTAAMTGVGEARASSIDASGHLVYADGALLTFGFESLPDAQAVGASWLTWAGGTTVNLAGAEVTSTDWAGSLVTGTDALEGKYALRLSASSGYVGLGLLDTTLFKKVDGQRIVVSMWGRSHGAEPELDIVYPSLDEAIRPTGFGHIVAIRTGNETSDGWAEYSTGPIDGSLWGDDIAAIILTARYTTPKDTLPLDSPELFPGSGGPAFLDATGYALVDAVEVDAASGAPMTPSSCTQANVQTVCGDLGECMFGHCVDGTIPWGPVPQAADHRRDLAQRWEFITEHLGADRLSASQAPSVFTPSALAEIEAATTPRAFFGAQSALVGGVRDAHTRMGEPPSSYTVFHPYVDPFYPEYSGVLDLCLGLAEDDLPGGSGADVYAVFWVSPTGMLAGMLNPGAQLVQVDGMSPDDWMDSIEARFRPELPNDPSSEPSGRALIFGSAMSKFAEFAVFSTCTAEGVCTQQTINVGQMTYDRLNGIQYKGTTENSRPCTARLVNAVSSWTPADDDPAYDVPLYETVGAITSIQVDGFQGYYDSSASNPWHDWEDAFTSAFAAGTNVLIDFRQGHGGKFVLGDFLAHDIRGTGDPYAAFGVPRGDLDSIDPSWLFDPSLAACVSSPSDGADLCGWTGGDIDESTLASPPFGGVKIAWVDSDDLSMNDITPKKIQGLPNVRIFGPHPTTGAYGEISYLPPILGPWGVGSTQVLDFRYGSTLPLAMGASWSSGVGVPPDQIVTQKLSDLLAGQDTLLAAAETWLEAP